MNTSTILSGLVGCVVLWLVWVSMVLPLDPVKATFILFALGLGTGFSYGVRFERARVQTVRAVIVEDEA